MGRAINKAVTIAEILKRKMPLHQCNALSSVEMIDIFEPLEEGLDRVESRRYGTLHSISLHCFVLWRFIGKSGCAMLCGSHLILLFCMVVFMVVVSGCFDLQCRACKSPCRKR
jgi:hypothetical protein